jgi:replicative DNA helicase
MEMLREDILARIIAIDSGINSERIRNPYTLNDEEWGRVFQAQNRIDNWQLIIDDKKRRTPDQILSLARQMQGRDGLDLIVIDYLQLMTDGLKHSGDNRVQEISNITTALKNIAGDLKIPVIVLSQLSRAVENRQDKRPVLSDLRDSGSIEQDADQVIFLYRDKYYHPEVPDDITEIDLKKCRNGKIGTVTARFVPELTKFVSVPQGQYVKNSSIPL